MDGQITPEQARGGANAKDDRQKDGAQEEPDGNSRNAGGRTAGIENLAKKARAWLTRAAAPASDDLSLEERLEALLNDEAQSGAPLSRSERMLLANVMRLRDARVIDVMVPRADVIALERGATLDETWQAFRSSGHSRLPVYRETLDDPIGVVHLKDVALSHGLGPRVNDFKLSAHVRDVMVVPHSMRVHSLLERMQASRKHMALVVDEYGGVDGLVTIEDLIEQIVGDIEDEHDDAEGPSWIELSGGVFLVEARAEVKDFESATGLVLLPSDWEEEIDTLGGLVFMLSGSVPARGEVVLHPDGHEFEVVDADPRRIKRLRVRVAATGLAGQPASE